MSSHYTIYKTAPNIFNLQVFPRFEKLNQSCCLVAKDENRSQEEIPHYRTNGSGDIVGSRTFNYKICSRVVFYHRNSLNSLPEDFQWLAVILERFYLNWKDIIIPLASPGTTTMTFLPESFTSQTASISVSFPSSCTNLADCIHVTTENQSKDDGINPKIKYSVKSIQRINSDTNTQGTLIAAFNKCNRKLSPNKEADTERENLKVSRSNHMDVYELIISARSKTDTGLYFHDQNKWIIAYVSLCSIYNINNYYKYFLTLLY